MLSLLGDTTADRRCFTFFGCRRFSISTYKLADGGRKSDRGNLVLGEKVDAVFALHLVGPQVRILNATER